MKMTAQTKRSSSAKAKAPKKTGAKTKAELTKTKSPDNVWRLRLYVAGQTPKSLAAFANLKRLCEQYLPGQYQIEVVDLLKNPELAQGDQILAVPTLVRKMPTPIKKVIGNLANADQTLVGLDMQ